MPRLRGPTPDDVSDRGWVHSGKPTPEVIEVDPTKQAELTDADIETVWPGEAVRASVADDTDTADQPGDTTDTTDAQDADGTDSTEKQDADDTDTTDQKVDQGTSDSDGTDS